MINRQPMSEETKKKISNTMKKKFPATPLTEEHKQTIIVNYIMNFLEYKRNILIKSQARWEILINCQWSIVDEENMDNTKYISIYEFQKRISESFNTNNHYD